MRVEREPKLLEYILRKKLRPYVEITEYMADDRHVEVVVTEFIIEVFCRGGGLCCRREDAGRVPELLPRPSCKLRGERRQCPW